MTWRLFRAPNSMVYGRAKRGDRYLRKTGGRQNVVLLRTLKRYSPRKARTLWQFWRQLSLQYSLTYKNPFYKNNARPFLKNQRGHPLRNILIVDRNIWKFKNMGEGELENSEGKPEKADSYKRGNTVSASFKPFDIVWRMQQKFVGTSSCIVASLDNCPPRYLNFSTHFRVFPWTMIFGSDFSFGNHINPSFFA